MATASQNKKIERLDQVKEGSTITIQKKGEGIFCVMVDRVSKCQIDVSYMKNYGGRIGWGNAYLSFAPNGNIKYLKGEKGETFIVSVNTI